AAFLPTPQGVGLSPRFGEGRDLIFLKRLGMNQCPHCNKPCSDTGILCEVCRTLIQHSRKQPVQPLSDLAVAIPLSSRRGEDGLKYMAVVTPFTPFEASSMEEGVDQSVQEVEMTPDAIEQTLHRLNDAARQAVSIDPDLRRRPHASRLAPLLDIS